MEIVESQDLAAFIIGRGGSMIKTFEATTGCRVQVQLANCKPDEVRLDLPVEYVFRKIHDAGGKANYFWKASPVQQREGEGGAA